MSDDSIEESPRDVLTAAQIEELMAQGRIVHLRNYALDPEMHSPMILFSGESEKYRRITLLLINEEGELQTLIFLRPYIPSSPAVESLRERQGAMGTAQTMFEYLRKKIGDSEARQIFGEIAGFLKGTDNANCTLLADYIYSQNHGDRDLKRFERSLSEFEKRRPQHVRRVYGRTMAGIKHQLERLIGKKLPPKKASPYLRALMKEAADLRQQTKRPPGRPTKK